MSNFLRDNKNKVLAAVLASVAGFALTACGVSSDAPSDPESSKTKIGPWDKQTYSDGVRTYEKDGSWDIWRTFCDGRDLLDECLGDYKGSIARTPNHPVCADGYLSEDELDRGLVLHEQTETPTTLPSLDPENP